jgi:hypothetical protein
MIFRDKKTGALLNIRRDEYINDRLYFQEMIRVINGNQPVLIKQPRYIRAFHELQSQNNYT